MGRRLCQGGRHVPVRRVLRAAAVHHRHILRAHLPSPDVRGERAGRNAGRHATGECTRRKGAVGVAAGPVRFAWRMLEIYIFMAKLTRCFKDSTLYFDRRIEVFEYGTHKVFWQYFWRPK